MKRARTRRAPRSGFTIVEVLLTAVILVLVVRQASDLLGTASEAVGTASAQMQLEDQAQQTLDRIAIAIMGSDRESLSPAGEGIHLDRLGYRISLGLVDGAVVWADPEEVGVGEQPNQVLWRENPGEAEERRVVWSNRVAAMLEGEVPNGIDDNGNGLIDETGLSLVVNGRTVQVRLTLQRVGDDGEVLTDTKQTVLNVRN